MPVMRLSRITTVMVSRLYTASTSEVMPLWIKVLSPSTATVPRENALPCARSAPPAMPMLAPMHRQASMALSGGSAASV